MGWSAPTTSIEPALPYDDLVDDFEVWLIDDRAAACPQHTVELEPSELGQHRRAPAIIRGHRVVARTRVKRSNAAWWPTSPTEAIWSL
jgi:hypothetical protein